RIAKSLVLFGKNATGKTNILKALENVLKIIKKGLDLNYHNKLINKESEFISYILEIVGKKNEIYKYELKFNKDKILFESLSKNSKEIFTFQEDKLKFDSRQEFEKLLSTKSTDTILNKLKDSKTAIIDNFKTLIDLYSYNANINYYDSYDYTQDESIFFQKRCVDFYNKYKDAVLNILSKIDESISDFNFIDLKDNRFALVILRNDTEFAFDKESSGVKKIIQLIFQFVYIYNGGTKSAININDELDSSISTISLIKLLNSIINSSNNQHSQFIFSSHNPLIFDIDILNPAQICIVSKNKELSTTISSLNDFDLRGDKRKAYLNYLRGDYE
ncbi:MAG: ATP-binding protein, partial [Campylobacter sp.]|nr:ATP-binding protein [Campylobacter sp.]